MPDGCNITIDNLPPGASVRFDLLTANLKDNCTFGDLQLTAQSNAAVVKANSEGKVLGRCFERSSMLLKYSGIILVVEWAKDSLKHSRYSKMIEIYCLSGSKFMNLHEDISLSH